MYQLRVGYKLNRLRYRFLTSEKINRLKKKINHFFYPADSCQIIFVFGCQRSGTTLLQKILNLSSRIQRHGEGEAPYFYPENDLARQFRLQPKDIVLKHLNYEKSEMITIKPLYETFQLNALMSDYPDAKVFFMYRNYRDVVKSHLKYYAHINALEYVKPLFESEKNHWLTENLPNYAKNNIRSFRLKDLSNSDAYALYWYARNSVGISQINDNVEIVNYDKLISQPITEIPRICKFVDVKARPTWPSIIRLKEEKRSRYQFRISPEIEIICEELSQKLMKLTLDAKLE